jgi:hypothetical protein
MVPRDLGVLASLFVAGCVVDPGGASPLPSPSRASFAVEAGPLLARRCADYGCHGHPDHAFALYAMGRRRLAHADAGTAHPLSSAEVDANYMATLGFLDAPRPRDTLLLRKALGLAGHKGGAVFAAPSDPECDAVMAWIAGRPE